jgi:protein required for attachment to host cells
MGRRWIAVVTRTRARILDRRDFSLIRTFDNDLGRERSRAMSADKPGVSRGKYAANPNIHRLARERSPHEEAAVVFARKVSSYLTRSFNQHYFDDILVVAEPRMMGRLRKHFSRRLLDHCQFEMKDLGRMSLQALRDRINAEFREKRD